ncbi:hypothetical protein COO60DRAFT_538874 [Scenedesmus sp. NREL 46B-D3]|nr:hypothetical protein COO60DRAFT_538874 [Scenedesmus sp. NREL 46B-D3]
MFSCARLSCARCFPSSSTVLSWAIPFIGSFISYNYVPQRAQLHLNHISLQRSLAHCSAPIFIALICHLLCLRCPWLLMQRQLVLQLVLHHQRFASFSQWPRRQLP